MRISKLFICLFISIFLSTGCAAWKPLKNKSVASLPEFYQGYYDYPPRDTAAEKDVLLEETRTESFILRKVEIPLTLPESLQRKNLEEFKKHVNELFKTDRKTANDLKLQYLCRIDYYIPANLKPGERRPVVLISPILGGNMVVDHFAKYYAGRGYVAAIVHRKRIHWDDERSDMGQLEDYLRISVIRLRQAVDWLGAQPEVDPDRIGAFGISYGAILHSVLAAVEPRIRYHVLAMPAAPLADVIIHCPDKGITKMVKHVKKKYGWSEEKIYQDLKAAIKTDPIYLAPYTDRRKIKMYIAVFDRVVGAKHSFRLWKALGKPEMNFLPFGHYGGILVFPFLQTQSYIALKNHLKENRP